MLHEADKRLTEIFRWTSRATFALPKRVSAFFVLQKLLHLECLFAGYYPVSLLKYNVITPKSHRKGEELKSLPHLKRQQSPHA